MLLQAIILLLQQARHSPDPGVHDMAVRLLGSTELQPEQFFPWLSHFEKFEKELSAAKSEIADLKAKLMAMNGPVVIPPPAPPAAGKPKS